MNRRIWLHSVAMSGLAIWCSSVRAAEDGVADLSETLRFGLKCRRPVEFAFVDLVVLKVKQKQLPKDLVLSTFEYARKQRDDIPFPYFVAALRKRAAAIGVEL